MRNRDDREVIIWDGNRLSMPTQRQFHAAVQEVRGERMMTVPSAAEEMAPLIDTSDWAASRTLIGAEIERRRTRSSARRGRDSVLNAEVQMWWLDEWSRPDGLYGVRELNDSELERYERLIEHVPIEGFAGATDRESVITLPDAQIVCETIAIDARLLLTHDPNTIRPARLLGWTRALAEAGYISHAKVVEEADEANERWVEETPEDMLLATIVCAWPQETDAGSTGVKTRVDALLKRLALAGLEDTSAKLGELVAATNNLAELIERANDELPVEMRNAERRSPYVSWTGAQERPRGQPFSVVWTGKVVMLVHRSLNGTEHEWGQWTRSELDEMERFLAARHINVAGLPEPRGSAGGGLVAGMNVTIDDLERTMTRKN